MNWFSRLCRNLGLMVHNVRNPDDEAAAKRRMIRRDVREEKRRDVILRRTTIDEVEFRDRRGEDDNERP